jgi:hypothetical protein
MEEVVWSALRDDVRADAERRFGELAKAQRGLPEILAVSTRRNPALFNATGAFSYLAEHIGDLSHRLSDGCACTGFGFNTTREKVGRGLRYYRNGFGLEQEVAVNLRNNFRIRREDGFALSFEQFIADFKAAAGRYAAAHAGLVVWNEAQWHGREAAIALGRCDYDRLLDHLEVLEARNNEGLAAWVEWAGTVCIADEGMVPFDPECLRSGYAVAPV